MLCLEEEWETLLGELSTSPPPSLKDQLQGFLQEQRHRGGFGERGPADCGEPGPFWLSVTNISLSVPPEKVKQGTGSSARDV